MGKDKPAGLAVIEEAAKDYADAYNALMAQVTEIENAIADIQQEAAPELRRLVAAAKTAKGDCTLLIESNRHLFGKPKTKTFHGVKVGLQRSKGKVVYDCDDDVMVTRIRTLQPKLFNTLVAVKETPVKDALRALPDKVRHLLGFEIKSDTYLPVVTVGKSDVLKAAEALLTGDGE